MIRDELNMHEFVIKKLKKKYSKEDEANELEAVSLKYSHGISKERPS